MMNICHGGDIYSCRIKYDFSANINPLGMPQSVKKALIGHIDDFENYPDVNCTQLRNSIADHENIMAENIVCGNGAADLIYRIVQTINPGKALLPVPTFSEYEKALLSCGCKVEHFLLDEKNFFRIDASFLEHLIDVDMIFLCNPNNPTGAVIEQKLMKHIIDKCRKNHIYLVLDECFMDFVQDDRRYNIPSVDDNVIILKAFTKIYAMAGLRLGYLICHDKNLVERIHNCGQCWSVSVPAQIAGAAALNENIYVEKTVHLITEQRQYLVQELEKFGFRVYKSEANFILFRCNIAIDKMLLNKGFSVRNCNNYDGLGEGFFRIAVRTHTENKALINAIERIMKNG